MAAVKTFQWTMKIVWWSWDDWVAVLPEGGRLWWTAASDNQLRNNRYKSV